MTTDQIIEVLEGIGERNPTERDIVEQLKKELRFRRSETLNVERALHDAMKILEKERKK